MNKTFETFCAATARLLQSVVLTAFVFVIMDFVSTSNLTPQLFITLSTLIYFVLWLEDKQIDKPYTQ